MSLNIEDPEVHQLAQQISEVTGESLSNAVKVALQERYERLQNRKKKASVDELLAMGKRASAGLKRPYLDHAEILYDDDGIPK